MKQKMKHLVSFIALLVMMVSMFSVWAFPATAATDEYASMLRRALVVNSQWEGLSEGYIVSFDYRGKTYTMPLDNDYHFASYADALAYIEAKQIGNPIVLLCADTYAERIEIKGDMTLLGPNAGIDPNVKSSDPKVAWTLNTADRGAEAVIKSDIVIRLAAGNANLTVDGLRFEQGGAIVDTQRNSGASELVIKNTVFDGAGNEGLSKRYALYLRSAGHARVLTLKNLYVTNMNMAKPESTTATPDLSFISPFFTELYVNNLAYINNRNGFLTHTWFAKGVSPVVEVTDSCFYNEKANTPISYAISMDNFSYDFDFTNAVDADITAATDRPAASMKLRNNVFYQASGMPGVLHYEFINAASVIDIQNNYVYADDDNANNGSTIMDSEFLYNSAGVDQSACMVIKNNRLIGAYRIPSLLDSNEATYIDMSDNYFATTSGLVVSNPVFMAAEDQRLARDRFWINEEMTVTQEDWQLDIDNWLLAWVDDFRYSADLLIYEASDLDAQTFTFKVKDGFSYQLYRKVQVSSDGVVTGAHEIEKIPNNKLSSALLGNDPYAPREVYVQILKDGDSSFAPFYTIRIENMGSMASLENFADAYSADHFMYKPEIAGVAEGAAIPYRWKNKIYKFEAGVNIFSDFGKIFDYAAAKGIESPTILLPAGLYTEELVLKGSCTILGEQCGINPNKPVVETITKENVASSAWILNPERDQTKETEFNACIRTAENMENYVITIDGIKMGTDCSYVDDYDRTGECVTIFKNVYAKTAGGGLDRNGDVNAYVFNFERNFSSTATDRNSMYMYDSRIDALDGRVAFGPYHEKFVLDGIFFGNCINQSKFCLNFRSRDIPNPYYSITNSYFYNNTGTNMASNYLFNFTDKTGNLDIKTNIVYVFDNNTFFNGLGKARGFQIYFTGNNMKVNFTNNTFVQESDSDTLFVSTSTNSRFHTTCKNQNVSDMMNIKGNRLIGKNRLPCTGNTGDGTMLDWSGNYFAATYDGPAQLPDGALRFGTISESSTYTYEQNTRVKIDYTFMDWDMTIRSDADTPIESKYDVTTGMFGTGTYKASSKTYTDTVAADCTVYDAPFIIGEYSVLKLYSSEKLTESSRVTELTLPNAVNTYYAVIASASNSSVKETVKLVINRELNTENELYYMDGFLIDSDAKTIDAYVEYDEIEYSFYDAVIETSAGATYTLYRNASCEAGDELINPDMEFHNPCYLKVTSEDGNKSTVYKVKFIDISALDPSEVETAAITFVEGMSRVDTTTFEAKMLNSETTFTFKPHAIVGGTYEIFNGSAKLAPNADGSYTVNNAGTSDLKLKAVVTSGNGENTATYTLNINKSKGSRSELISISGASKREGFYLLNMGVADAAVIKAEVSAGATYQVYSDYNCKTPCANNLVTAQQGNVTRDIFNVFLKVTSEDGLSSSIHKITLQSSAGYNSRALITGTYGNASKTANLTGDKEFTLYLPAGVKEVKLEGNIKKDTYDAYGKETKDAVVAEMKFYADRAKKIEILPGTAVNLEQKITKVYAIMEGASYLNKVDDVMYTVRTTKFEGVLNIVSDRASVTYSDAATLNNHWVKTYVDYLNNEKFGFFMGDDAGKININQKITRYELAASTCRILGLDVTKYTEKNAPLTYEDFVADWALPYVRATAANNIINGHAEGDKLYFHGDSNATREQVFKVMVSLCMINEDLTEDGAAYYNANKASIDKEYNKFSFADNNKVSEWAMPYVRLAVVKYHLVSGSDEYGKLYLNPQNDITRGEVGKMVAIFFGYDK